MVERHEWIWPNSAQLVFTGPYLYGISLNRGFQTSGPLPSKAEATNTLFVPMGTTAILTALVQETKVDVLVKHLQNRGPKKHAAIEISSGGTIRCKFRNGTYHYKMYDTKYSTMFASGIDDEAVLGGLRIHSIGKKS